MAKIKKAIIAVAGSATRFLPVTKSMPKEMLPIVDKPIIQLLVEEMVAAGGMYVQMELGSFAGFYGETAARRAHDILSRRLVHVVATDLHAAADAVLLSEALAHMHQQWGKEVVAMLLDDNPRALLTGAYRDIRRLP